MHLVADHKMKNIVSLISILLIAGCSPRIAVEAPKEPITINLNVKIDHEVRVKVDKDLDRAMSKDSNLF